MDLAQACVTYSRNLMKWLLKLLFLGTELQPHKPIKTCLLLLTPYRQVGYFKFIPAAFLETRRTSAELLSHFLSCVRKWVLRGFGVQTAIRGALLFTLVQTSSFYSTRCGRQSSESQPPIPLHTATPRAAGLYVIFANWNALVG